MGISRVWVNLCTTRARCIALSDTVRDTDVSEGSSMAWQLGSSPKIIAKNEIDEIKTMFLVGSDQLPNQLKPMLYHLIRYAITNLNMSYSEAVVYYFPKLMDAIGGRGQNNILRAEQTNRGIPVQPEVAPEKPSALDRIMDRDKVREYEAWKDRKELGLE